jgi:hypothetical protein
MDLVLEDIDHQPVLLSENKKDILLGQRVIFAMVQSHIENSRIIDLEEIDPQMKIEAITNGKFA